MDKLMVEQAGSRFFEFASTLGRMHVKTLTGLADATAKTPLGPVFAVNASVARMMNEGVESIAHKLVGDNGAASDAPVKKAAAPVAKAKPAAKKAAAKADKPVKETKPAAKAKAATSLSIEPEADEVLVDDNAAVEAVASAKADDLTVISGIGATTAKKLNGAGINGFADIAAMTEDKFADLLASLDIKSIRFSPAKWIEEAKMFAAKAN